MNVIITGATGMVGEGVLLECLASTHVSEVLVVNGRQLKRAHPKLKELIVPDFLKLDDYTAQLTGHDACFYCAGASSMGVDEATFSHATYDTILHFAQKLSDLNPAMVFNFVSGYRTDSSEEGNVMWARVKGRTENALMRLPFKSNYNFRPGFMKPTPGQKNVTAGYRVFAVLYPLLIIIFPHFTCTMKEVGLAMINSVLKGYSKGILEVRDIKLLARG